MTPTKKIQFPKDYPLRCEVVKKVLAITIGVDTLAFADKERTGLEVTDAEGFARDVVRALERQAEDGATMLTDLLDEAMEAAENDGSVHVDIKKTEKNRKAMQ